jgi:hypothetical protein
MPDTGTLPFGKDRAPDYPETEDRAKLSAKQRAALVLKQEGRCALCACKPRKFEGDHIQELWEGGTNEPDNWQMLCPPCHKLKSGAAAKRRAKMNRLRHKTGQIKRRKERAKPLIQSKQKILSRGFSRPSSDPSKWQGSNWPKGRKLASRNSFQKRAVK